MSVDTNVKGKNVAAYRKLRHERFQILITPTLIGMADSMRVVTKGRLSKSLAVEFRSSTTTPSTDACEL
ncbi:MAG TPA: hypothetical protein VLN74_02980 [Ilumatobacteraceae bacterium]|nr:hypothetical protein [Ilumatobacteraceae bacterium]